MCGRYAFAKITEEEKQFMVRYNLPFPIYNAAPSVYLPVISNLAPTSFVGYRWGLIPHWANDEKIGYKTINARSEAIFETASFKMPIRERRCLVPANCYYEWKKEEDGTKTPYLIYTEDRQLFTMAGVWDEWVNKATGELVRSFSIITTAANSRLEGIHHRMPVIIPVEERQNWLSPVGEAAIQQYFKAYPNELVNAYPIASAVNSPANNEADILQPVGPRIA